MILLFKACCKFGAHFLCHCATSFFVTLDPKTTPMYSQRTCKSYYCLHNISKSITKWMEQPTKRGKRLWWSSQNPAIKHNKRVVFQRQCMVCPLNVVVKELSLQSNHIWIRTFVSTWYTWVHNFKTRRVKYAIDKMLLDIGML